MPTFRVSSPPTPRSQIGSTARGLIAETLPPQFMTGGTIPTCNAASGQIVVGLVGLRAGDIVTNLVACVNVIGVSVSTAKLGLWDAASLLPLAATASVSATFNGTTGYKVVPLTAPYTITADGGYYVGYLQFGAGATGATLSRGGTATGLGSQIGTSPRINGSMVNQTDVNVTLSLADATVSYWFGVS